MHAKNQNLQSFFSLTRESHVKPGSYRLQRLLGRQFFHVSHAIPSILVGGTNGKGTTCAFLESIFRHSGLKTGLYTSPHLVSPNERIRISGTPVSEKEILDTIGELDINKNLFLPDATFFECMTAAALLLFCKHNVEIIICEVGLGGRYDSTNVINPWLSVLTGVSLEHTQILGNTVSAIAKDKSYIARRNKPFVVSSTIPKRALNTVHKTSQTIGCNMILTSQKLDKKAEKIFFDHVSHPASTNLRTALIAVHEIITHYQNIPQFSKITTKTIRDGIKNMFWPGRFDIRYIGNKTFIFDCAHNPGGVQFFLKQYLQSKFASEKFHVLFATLKDKNWKENLALLSRFIKSISIMPFANERAEKPETILTHLKNTVPNIPVFIDADITHSVNGLLNTTSKNPILVTGSIAFVGAVFESLNINVFNT